MKVLIVDDNKQARAMIKQYLRDLTDETRECEDGADVLSAYKAFLPDWVLMDWEMKRVNGLVATRQIIANFPDAKILMVTNYNEKDLQIAAKDAGASGFVLKDDLLTLHSFLKKANEHQPGTKDLI
ncbi:MAG: response regulator transcription factor [Pyrinomonadaceae bacterium]